MQRIVSAEPQLFDILEILGLFLLYEDIHGYHCRYSPQEEEVLEFEQVRDGIHNAAQLRGCRDQRDRQERFEVCVIDRVAHSEYREQHGKGHQIREASFRSEAVSEHTDKKHYCDICEQRFYLIIIKLYGYHSQDKRVYHRGYDIGQEKQIAAYIDLCLAPELFQTFFHLFLRSFSALLFLYIFLFIYTFV